jgi:hypothetical protein
MQLVTTVGLTRGKFKVHAANDDLFPLCNKKKRGTPVITGTVKLDCEKCRNAMLRAKSPKKQANSNPF